MNPTSFIQKRKTTNRTSIESCHGGSGELDFSEVLDFRDEPKRKLNFIHYDILKPGVSVGVHEHHNDEEYYYVLSGQGLMIVDGKEVGVEEGDIVGVFPGGFHGITNDSDTDLRLIVVSIKTQ